MHGFIKLLVNAQREEDESLQYSIDQPSHLVINTLVAHATQVAESMDDLFTLTPCTGPNKTTLPLPDDSFDIEEVFEEDSNTVKQQYLTSSGALWIATATQQDNLELVAQGQANVGDESYADCGESMIRNFFNYILYDSESKTFTSERLQALLGEQFEFTDAEFDESWLGSQRLFWFYNKYSSPSYCQKSRDDWTKVIYKLPNSSEVSIYFTGGTSEEYEIDSGVDNVFGLLALLLNNDLLINTLTEAENDTERRTIFCQHLSKIIGRIDSFNSMEITSLNDQQKNFPNTLEFSMEDRPLFRLSCRLYHFAFENLSSLRLNINPKLQEYARHLFQNNPNTINLFYSSDVFANLLLIDYLFSPNPTLKILFQQINDTDRYTNIQPTIQLFRQAVQENCMLSPTINTLNAIFRVNLHNSDKVSYLLNFMYLMDVPDLYEELLFRKISSNLILSDHQNKDTFFSSYARYANGHSVVLELAYKELGVSEELIRAHKPFAKKLLGSRNPKNNVGDNLAILNWTSSKPDLTQRQVDLLYERLMVDGSSDNICDYIDEENNKILDMLSSETMPVFIEQHVGKIPFSILFYVQKKFDKQMAIANDEDQLSDRRTQAQFKCESITQFLDNYESLMQNLSTKLHKLLNQNQKSMRKDDEERILCNTISILIRQDPNDSSITVPASDRIVFSLVGDEDDIDLEFRIDNDTYVCRIGGVVFYN